MRLPCYFLSFYSLLSAETPRGGAVVDVGCARMQFVSTPDSIHA